MQKPLGSLLTAMVTPFTDDLQVDYDAAQGLAWQLIREGSDGLVLAGTTGEAPTLTHKEKLQLFKVIKEALGDAAKIIAGTGSYNTQASIELTKDAEETGADAVMAVVPYYNRPPQEGLYQHFKAIAQATSLPVIIYNIPGRTSCNIEPETVAKLAADVPNIIAIKEASKNLEQVAEIIKRTGDDFLVYSGDDSTTLPILALGGIGVISVASHIAGNDIKAMIQAYFRADIAQAKELNRRLLPLFKVLFITTNPIPVKAALKLTGALKSAKLRLPLTEATEQQKEAISKVLRELGYLH